MEKAMLRTWPLDSAMGRAGREGSWVAVRGENRGCLRVGLELVLTGARPGDRGRPSHSKLGESGWTSVDFGWRSPGNLREFSYY